MNRKKIIVTKSDFDRLERLLDSWRRMRRHDAKHIEALEDEINRAVVVDEAAVGDDVVTMESRVRVRDLKSGEEFVWQIVYPHHANPEKNQISVLAPIGTALLGYRAGDTIAWQVPGGTRRLRILKVEYQPETHRAAA
jgi:regulator of nucleoside diphosphate kinase